MHMVLSGVVVVGTIGSEHVAMVTSGFRSLLFSSSWVTHQPGNRFDAVAKSLLSIWTWFHFELFCRQLSMNII